MSIEHAPERASAQALGHIDPLLDETRAGEYLGGEGNPLSPRTMQRWRNARTGPAWVQVGRLIRYRKSELDRFLAAGEQRPAA